MKGNIQNKGMGGTLFLTISELFTIHNCIFILKLFLRKVVDKFTVKSAPENSFLKMEK